MTPIVSPERIDALAQVYTDFDRAFNRTKSRSAVDGGLILLALLDELREIRATLQHAAQESAKGRGR